MKIKDEITYQITMKYLKQMLEKGIISIDEYNKIENEINKKYTLKISPLFEENH